MSRENNLTECMCEFCGQVVQADDQTMRLANQDKNIAAKLVCDCPAAKKFCHDFTVVEKGIAMVDNICGRHSERPLEADVVNILHSAVNRIAKRQMVGITLNISQKEKIKLELGKKGIKCNRTVTETETDECIF